MHVLPRACQCVYPATTNYADTLLHNNMMHISAYICVYIYVCVCVCVCVCHAQTPPRQPIHSLCCCKDAGQGRNLYLEAHVSSLCRCEEG
jgi:hypothetical protein